MNRRRAPRREGRTVMPVWSNGTCDVCGRHNVERTLIIGSPVDGRIYVGWVCGRCRADLRQLRNEIMKTRGSEKPGAEPGEEKAQGGKDDD